MGKEAGLRLVRLLRLFDLLRQGNRHGLQGPGELIDLLDALRYRQLLAEVSLFVALRHLCHMLQWIYKNPDLEIAENTGGDQRQRKHQNIEQRRRDGLSSDLLLDPGDAEVAGDDPGHISIRPEYGAVGAVKPSPRIRIGLFANRGNALAGRIKSIRIIDLLAELGVVLLRRIHGKGKDTVSLIPDPIDIFQLHIIPVYRQRVIDPAVSGLVLVLRLQPL